MMNILEILTQVEEQDPEVFERLSTRRRAMRSFAGLGKKMTLTAIPLALGAMFNKAYSQSTNPAVLDVLNFALTLEYLEYRFYQKAVGTANLIPTGAALTAITSIRDNEQAHVNFLKATIMALGGTPVSEPTFDFTGGNGSGTGPFKMV
ncbi:MAG: ferritin-like domain-containing protein, partial [Saprospiraceae bacterium]